jgi:hypothetical protein
MLNTFIILIEQFSGHAKAICAYAKEYIAENKESEA